MLEEPWDELVSLDLADVLLLERALANARAEGTLEVTPTVIVLAEGHTQHRSHTTRTQ